MSDHDKLDVAICGAGPVGMALAALLARRGIPGARIALIDAKPLASAMADPRSIALSYGSRMLLEEVGAWPVPATAIHEIHISRRGHLGRSPSHGSAACGSWNAGFSVDWRISCGGFQLWACWPYHRRFYLR